MPHGAIPFPFGDCRICEDRATGIHYGVATCEGCKGFFKRSLPKRDSFSCFFGGQCQVTRLNRNRCKACRLKRCLDNGMAVEAVKMGRIPKVEKERALYEAHYTTGAVAASGSASDSQVMAEPFPEHRHVNNDWDDLASGSDVSVSSAALASLSTTPGIDAYNSKQTSSQLAPTMSSGNQNEYGLMDLSRYFEGETRDPLNGKGVKSGNKVYPQTSINGNLQTDNHGIDHFGRRDIIHNDIHVNTNTNSSPELLDTTKLNTDNSTFTQLSTHFKPKSSQEYLNNGQSHNQWGDFPLSSKGNNQPLNLHNSLYANSPSSNAFGTYQSKGSVSKKETPVSSNFCSYEVKKELLDIHNRDKERKQPHSIESQLLTTNSYNQNNMIHSQPSVLGRQFFHDKNCREENTTQIAGHIFSEDTLHCDNPFAIVGSPQANCNINPGVSKTKLGDQNSMKSDLSLNEIGADVKNISMMEHSSSQNDSRSPLLPTRHPLSHYAVSTSPSHPPFICTSKSGSNSTGHGKPFDSASPITAKTNGRGCAYSPNVVKVLLNQVGGERLKGLKQHIMTGIAPECAPEEFQAAADLLRQYSEDSSASSATPDSNMCMPSPPSVPHNSTHPLYSQNGMEAMDTSETRYFDQAKLDASHTVLSGFDKQQTGPFSTSRTAHANGDQHQDSLIYTNADAKRSNHISLFYGEGNWNSPENTEINNTSEFGFSKHSLLNQCAGVQPLIASGGNQDFITNLNAANFRGTAPQTSWGSDAASLGDNYTGKNLRGEKTLMSEPDENCVMDMEASGLVSGDYMKDFLRGEANQNVSDTGSTDQISLCSNFQHNSSNDILVNGMLQHNGSNSVLVGGMSQNDGPNNTTVGGMLQNNSPNNTTVGGMLQHNGPNNTQTDGMSQGRPEGEISMSDLAKKLGSAFDIHMALFKQRHVEMLEILENKRAMPVHPVPGAKATVYQQLIGSIEDINKAIIGFCNCVPGLSTLPKADKDYLTKRAYYDIWMLTNSRLFHEGQTYLKLPDGTYYNREWMEVILNKKIVQVFFHFSVAFNSLELSDLEVAILCAIQLTSPGNESPGVCPISSKEKVEHINSQLVDLLVMEVGKRHKSNGPRVLVDIFRLLPNLAEINTLQQEIIANFTADTVPENVSYSPKSAPLADLSEEQLNAV